MNTLNPWLILIIAILLEVAGTLCLKLSNGMARLLPVLGVVVFYVSTFVLMAISMKRLEVGTAYAVWAGVGTALVTVFGIIIFGESVAWSKLAGTLLIIGGVILLHASTKETSSGSGEKGRQQHEVSGEGQGEQ
jgi:small multidrug resistance pump